MEDWVEKQQEPFFLWAFSLDTHFPYITPRKHRKWGSSIDMYYYNWRCNQLIDKMDIDLTEKERKKMLNIYDDSIRFGDILIRELKERLSEYDPIFVIFGDHGEAFNEHGLYGHFYPTLYEENIHVPLVIWDNNGNQQTVKKPTSLLDLPDMIINGLEGDIKSITRESVTAIDFDGRHDRHVLTTRGSEWKYILEVDGSRRSEEYYHLATDPQESENLLGEEEVPSELEYRTLRQFNTESEILKIRKGVENSHTNIEKLD
jgi:arylsulfatase